jgi:hypothetical protein
MGHVDTDADRQALRETLIERRVKAQKLRETRKKGSPAVPLDEVTVTEEEYEKYLAMAYKSEKFPKPRNILGFAKKLPAPEMERLMLTHIDVTDEDLRELSGERARAVYGYIIETGKVEPERVFLVEPEGISPEEREGVGKSRKSRGSSQGALDGRRHSRDRRDTSREKRVPGKTGFFQDALGRDVRRRPLAVPCTSHHGSHRGDIRYRVHSALVDLEPPGKRLVVTLSLY